jgi:hypothetical protein
MVGPDPLLVSLDEHAVGPERLISTHPSRFNAARTRAALAMSGPQSIRPTEEEGQRLSEFTCPVRISPGLVFYGYFRCHSLHSYVKPCRASPNITGPGFCWSKIYVNLVYLWTERGP